MKFFTIFFISISMTASAIEKDKNGLYCLSESQIQDLMMKAGQIVEEYYENKLNETKDALKRCRDERVADIKKRKGSVPNAKTAKK